MLHDKTLFSKLIPVDYCIECSLSFLPVDYRVLSFSPVQEKYQVSKILKEAKLQGYGDTARRPRETFPDRCASRDTNCQLIA